jgi:Adenylate and Guanylate cyclase catalytic domain
LKVTKNISDLKGDIYSGLPISMGLCEYRISLYASDEMKAEFVTNNPMMFSIVIVSIFMFTILIFLSYDCWVELRQRRLLKVAQQSSAVLTSLFPSNVRDRLFASDERNRREMSAHEHSSGFQPIKSRLRSFMDNDGGGAASMQSAPIADFFPASTVLFEDIAGFTAWSSMREPTQVFVLLESIYSEFDMLAEKRGVFKIETIGDSYVAVAGVPEARHDHAVVMTKFAIDCRAAMKQVTQKLTSTLGPDTADLKVSTPKTPSYIIFYFSLGSFALINCLSDHSNVP